jgi:hypothetical protein
MFTRYANRLRRRAAVGMFVIALAVAAPAALAAEITFVPTADTFVSAAEPSYNYGAAGSVEVSAPSAPNGEFQALLKFNTAEALRFFDRQFGAGGWKLDAATLRLTTSNPNNPLFNPNVAGPVAVSWMQNDAWLEGTGGPITPTSDGVTYATLPSFLGPADEALGTVNFPGGTSGSNTYGLSLAPGFTTDLKAGGDVSLRLAPGAGGSVSYLFASRTFTNTGSRPVLSLAATAVPEPAAGMAVVGLGAMLLGRRPRRS